MDLTYSLRPAVPEDAARIAVLGAQVWMHTYATAGVSEVIAQYVLATFTPEKMHALLSDAGVVIVVAEQETGLAGYVVMRSAACSMKTG
jgi:diamine N-acetyltransferase